MTVRELYNWCKAFKNKDAEVYLCKDWCECDEQGCLTDLYRLKDITYQVCVVESGMDFTDVYEAILEVEEERATAQLNRNY